MAENERQEDQKQDQNQGQYYLKLVAQGCFCFLDDSDEKTDEKIAGLYTQGAGPCACIIVKNQDNSRIVLAHVGDNNDISDEKTGLKHWIDLVSNHGQENVQVEVHLGCGRKHGNAEKNESGYKDWFDRVKKVLQNQSIDGKKLYMLCKKNENNGAENMGEAARKVIIKQPIGNRNYNSENETGIVLRKGYHLLKIILEEPSYLNTKEKKQNNPTIKKLSKLQQFLLEKSLKINKNNISIKITKEQIINQNPEQEQTVVFDDTIGSIVHRKSRKNMKKNAITIQEQLDKKLNQLVQQHYQKYLKSEVIKISEVTKISEAIKILEPVEITGVIQKNADLKVPLTDQGEIDELNYERELGENDFQQHPKYFTQINRYQINELKLFQELGKSGKLNREGERKLKRLELFKTQDDMNLAFKSGWSEYIKDRQNQTSPQRSDSCHF